MNSLILSANPTREEVGLVLRKTKLHEGEQAWAAGAVDRLLGRLPSNSAKNFHGSIVTDEMNRKLPHIELGGRVFVFGGGRMVELLPA